MSAQFDHIYEFGQFRLEVAERLLLGKEGPIPLTPKEFETLLYLVQQSGHLIEKEEFMRQVWPDTTVEEGNRARNVWALRRALGDDNSEHRYIETVPKRGYRFVAPVRELTMEGSGLLVTRRIRARIVSEEEYQEEGNEILTLPATDTTALTVGDAGAPLALPTAMQPRSTRDFGLIVDRVLLMGRHRCRRLLKISKASHCCGVSAPVRTAPCQDHHQQRGRRRAAILAGRSIAPIQPRRQERNLPDGCGMDRQQAHKQPGR
jgi:DNA-binding winged helix-turn-helix (wHTH) protein